MGEEEFETLDKGDNIVPFGSNKKAKDYLLRQESGTPQELFDVLNWEFDFQIDVAASRRNAKCDLFIPKELDAFRSPWVYNIDGQLQICRCFLNPPFADIAPWLEKAISEANRSPSAVVVVIVPGRPSSANWWPLAMQADEIRMLTPRPNFVPPPGVTYKGNSQETFVLIYRRKLYRRAPVFTSFPWRDYGEDIGRYKETEA